MIEILKNKLENSYCLAYKTDEKCLLDEGDDQDQDILNTNQETDNKLNSFAISIKMTLFKIQIFTLFNIFLK